MQVIATRDDVHPGDDPVPSRFEIADIPDQKTSSGRLLIATGCHLFGIGNETSPLIGPLG
jgi:hypothetical protein